LSDGRAENRASLNSLGGDKRQCSLVHVAGGAGAGEATSKYDLVANLCHDGKAGEGTYKVHIHRKKEELWCEAP